MFISKSSKSVRKIQIDHHHVVFWYFKSNKVKVLQWKRIKNVSNLHGEENMYDVSAFKKMFLKFLASVKFISFHTNITLKKEKKNFIKICWKKN